MNELASHQPAEIVNSYLTAYTSGDVDQAASLVTEDFSFQGPMQATAGRSGLRKIVAHVAANVRGHRVLHQWQDGDEVCTIYQLSVETGREATSVLVSEWNTVRGGHVAASLMVFDTGPFRGARQANATLVDPVCGMTVDPATAAAHRRHREHDYYFCSDMCAETFDANPEQTLAPHQA
jgi:YHS domain-containing protein/ketosteroid isomerase-like protein